MALILSGDTGPSFVQSSALPAGSVIQAIYANTGTQITVSSSTYTATPLQATITKQLSNSYILITVSPSIQAYYSSAGGPAKAGARIYETTASRVVFDSQCVVRSYDGGDVNLVATNVAIQYLDTQSGSGSRTYRLDIRNIQGADARLNIDTNNEATSHITLMEIAA